MREKRPGEDLVEDITPKKKSKTEDDLEQMMDLITRLQGREQQGELFRVQRQELVSRETTETHPEDRPSVQALTSIESIYMGIQESGKQVQK